jgi:uncharacterized protein YbjT (DUF2867 family)
MFTILGVTGNTGSAVARTLLEHGRKIRVVVRDEKKAAPWRETRRRGCAGLTR